MRIILAPSAPLDSDHIRFFTREETKPEGISRNEFNGSRFTTVLLRKGTHRIVCVGLGEEKNLSPNLLRKAAGVGLRSLLKLGATTRVTIDLRKRELFAGPAVEGALRAGYRFEDFLSEKIRSKAKMRRLTILANFKSHPKLRAHIQRAETIGNAINLARQLGNQPPNVMTPAALARAIREIAAKHPYRVHIRDRKALEKEGFRAILAVGSGSSNEPRFITLEPLKKISGAPTVAVVGKAISFDSGGLSLKTASGMEDMKFDKLGGCSALGVAVAAAGLKLPINLHVAIPSAENIPGQGAFRPGDIIRTWNGQTIEVLNTDAEGRVLLADALAYACKTWKPDILINFATLTGACVVALGEERAGLFSNDNGLAHALAQAGESSGDRMWRLPYGEEFESMIQSDVALVKNSTASRWGGASTAATFLSHWITAPKWAHLDIAGPAQIHKANTYMESGATGFGIGAVINYLRELTSSSRS